MDVQAFSSSHTLTSTNSDRELFLLLLKKKRNDKRTGYVLPCSVAQIITLLMICVALMCVSEIRFFSRLTVALSGSWIYRDILGTDHKPIDSKRGNVALSLVWASRF